MSMIKVTQVPCAIPRSGNPIRLPGEEEHEIYIMADAIVAIAKFGDLTRLHVKNMGNITYFFVKESPEKIANAVCFSHGYKKELR